METCESKRAKRKFVQAWLSDDRYKSWIREVPFDITMYHCILCNQNYSCDSSHVYKHIDSVCHKKSRRENQLDATITEEKRHKIKTFQHQWLEIIEFQPWLREVPSDASLAKCVICNMSITSNITHIRRHAETQMHRDKCEKSHIANKSNEDFHTQSDESLLSFDERVKSAEIRFSALIAEKNIPHQTAKEILSLFQQIQDPNVLAKMTMGRTKCQKIISNVLCPVETERVVNNIRNSKFSIFIDETSDLTNEKWMTFIVRYVDSETLDVQTQLVKLIDVDASDCSAEKLFNAFQSEMYKLQIPFPNILALSCDNASVMTGKHLSVKRKLEEKCKNLITIACPCHSAALAAHAACDKIPAFCEEFVRKIASYINSSPKRSAIFKEFTECFQDSSHRILKLCNTRWLSHYSCVERIIESWDTIKHFLTEMTVSEKTKTGDYLLSIMSNVDTKAYLLFLKYVLNIFNAFNAFFQAHETRVHLLYPKSVDFLLQFCRNFLKPEVLKDILINVTFSEENNHKSIYDLDLGAECERYLVESFEEGHANAIINIRQNCLQFYITAAEEIKKRLPFRHIFLYKLNVFAPHIALFNSNRETSFADVSFVAKTLGGFDENSLREEWLAMHNDFTIEEKNNLSKLNFDEMWKTIEKLEINNTTKYPNLRSLLNAVRSLPHSNADPERIFSREMQRAASEDQ